MNHIHVRICMHTCILICMHYCLLIHTQTHTHTLLNIYLGTSPKNEQKQHTENIKELHQARGNFPEISEELLKNIFYNGCLVPVMMRYLQIFTYWKS